MIFEKESSALVARRGGETLRIEAWGKDALRVRAYMADGKSSFIVSRISKHLLSQMDTLESFLDVRFGVERKKDGYHFSVNPGAAE